MILKTYTNVDSASSIDDRWSTFGYCTFLKENLVTGKSKKQNTMVRSSVEAEFIVMTLEILEILFKDNFRRPKD